ncbi:DUF1056 domain-containing protein [Fructobacillus sp. M158]|uniref:DUF1056 domain-containing protein n=1 Tax=Fructobacillus parabroussonetiae TaxID=2713174 RepID=UPI00200A9CE5|nr:DUF1056 domain-containing protein [Fructobacillus parabroussonetiae]MCK8617548.1 DUF1056 domain-containing protein [Fructobacillus parabroussonetiae]
MFNKFLALFWAFFDVIFYLISAVFANVFISSFGIRWLWLSLSVTCALIALASGRLALSNEGGNQ